MLPNSSLFRAELLNISCLPSLIKQEIIAKIPVLELPGVIVEMQDSVADAGC